MDLAAISQDKILLNFCPFFSWPTHFFFAPFVMEING